MSQPFPPYQESSAHQSASRKMKRKYQGGGVGPTSQQQQHRGPHHPNQSRGGGGHGGHSRPGAGGAAFLAPPASTGPMAWGHAFEDESTDMIMDEMDRLTPRDLAVARFRRNHELLDAIFDEKKIANLQPGPSPYSGLSQADLQAQLERSEAQIKDIKKRHEDRVQSFKHNLTPDFIEREAARQAEGNEDDESVEPWARNPGKGRRLTAGFAYVQARTPDIVKATIKAREAALSGQRNEQETVLAKEQKAAEDEAIRKLNLEYGMEPPPPVNQPLPPPQIPQQAPLQTQQQLAQQQQPQTQTQTQTQPQRQEVPAQQQQSTEVLPTDQGKDHESSAAALHGSGNASGAPAEAPEIKEQTVHVAETDAQGDQNMIEIVGSGEESAVGLAASEQTAPKEQAEQPMQEHTGLQAVGEAEALTHPLSAEAQASSFEAESDAKALAAETGVADLPAVKQPSEVNSAATSEPAAETTQEPTAPEGTSESVADVAQVPAPDTVAEPLAQSNSEVNLEVPSTQPNSELIAEPPAAQTSSESAQDPVSETPQASIAIPPSASAVTEPTADVMEGVPKTEEVVMKAPTPSLEESLAENDAPKQM